MSVPETRRARTTGTRRRYPDAYRKRILALSDERNWWLRRVYRSWREGQQACETGATPSTKQGSLTASSPTRPPSTQPTASSAAR